jgi:hypothetical protein
MNGLNIALPLVKRKIAGIPTIRSLGVVNSCLTVSKVVGVPAGPVQLVNVHVVVPKLEGSACATATVVAAVAETHARVARNGLSRFISSHPLSTRL